MADLGAGRASNGGARTGGPVPVSTGTPSGMRTPRQIMKDRADRDARRLEEQKSEEQRRLTEERRRSADRRAATVTSAAPRFRQSSSQYTPDAQQGQFDGASDRRNSRSGNVAGTDVLGEPVGRTTQEYPASRPRVPSTSQQEQTRLSQSGSGARRTQQSQSAPRQPAPAATAQSQQQPGSASSFPHAFERWETLSSHWEGLTSYWLHKLEQNTEEIRTAIPNASTLNRQITDLSAAGANLFHAVVELQRLRASSERKFQRWFFETRADTERNQEVHGSLERQLRLERTAKEEALQRAAAAEEIVTVSKRETAESRRELMISKEEARRAWEELGRRNQESLETAQSLKEGRLTVVAGVQVVPYFGGPSRTGSNSQRPATRDGPQYYGSASGTSNAPMGGLQVPPDEAEYYRNDPSPTNTDPFTESGRQEQTSLHHEPGKSSLGSQTYQPYPQGSTPTTSGASAQTVIPSPQRAQQSSSTLGPSRTPGARSAEPTTSAAEAQRFYQHAPADTILHSPSTGPGQDSPQIDQPVSSPQREDVRSEASYVDTLSEGETEYAIDSSGNIRHDEQGRPIIFRRRIRSDESEEYEDDETNIRREEALRRERERELAEAQQIMPEAPSVPATSAEAMEDFDNPTSGPTESEEGEYEGAGYGGWESLQTRHHHPTRLSDVLEEEEERSSRRTGD